MKKSSQLGFTLIELLISMALMSIITAACIWVFQQSMDLYSKSVGRGEVNQNMRVAEEKLRKDLLSCLSLDSGEQRFIMISRYGRDNFLNKQFPRDYLSFTTMTRFNNQLTQAVVSYDIVETNAGLPILYRYSQTVDDIKDTTNTNVIKKEVVAEYCTEFKVEYLWQDPRPEGASFPSANNDEKIVPDPGIFLSLHPALNEETNGKNVDAAPASGGYYTGGLNGARAVFDASGAHASGTVVGRDYNDSIAYGTGGIGGRGGIIIYNRTTGVPTANDSLERSWSTPGMRVKKGIANGTNVSPAINLPGPATLNAAYNRIIYIRSPNLIGDGTATRSPSATPVDITAKFTSGFEDDLDATRSFVDYEIENDPADGLWPTYVPSMLRITLKIYNADRKIVNTRAFVFSISTAGR